MELGKGKKQKGRSEVSRQTGCSLDLGSVSIRGSEFPASVVAFCSPPSSFHLFIISIANFTAAWLLLLSRK